MDVKNINDVINRIIDIYKRVWHAVFMDTYRTKIGQGGRVVIPSEYRKAANLNIGDEIILRLDRDGEIKLSNIRKAVKTAQKIIRSHIPKGRSLSMELIDERRKDARRG